MGLFGVFFFFFFFFGSTFAYHQSVFTQPVLSSTNLTLSLRLKPICGINAFSTRPKPHLASRPGAQPLPAAGLAPFLDSCVTPHGPSFSFWNVPSTIPSHSLCTRCPLCPRDKYCNLSMSKDLDKIRQKSWIETNNHYWL